MARGYRVNRKPCSPVKGCSSLLLTKNTYNEYNDAQRNSNCNLLTRQIEQGEKQSKVTAFCWKGPNLCTYVWSFLPIGYTSMLSKSSFPLCMNPLLQQTGSSDQGACAGWAQPRIFTCTLLAYCKCEDSTRKGNKHSFSTHLLPFEVIISSQLLRKSFRMHHASPKWNDFSRLIKTNVLRIELFEKAPPAFPTLLSADSSMQCTPGPHIKVCPLVHRWVHHDVAEEQNNH